MAISQKKSPRQKLKKEEKSYTQLFMEEIIQFTGMKEAEIAAELGENKRSTLNADRISQYLNGHKNASDRMLLRLARQTKKLGWEIPSAQALLDIDEVMSQDTIENSVRREKKAAKERNRSEKFTINALEKSVNKLLREFEHDGLTVIALVALMTEKIYWYDIKNAGAVNAEKLADALGMDGSKFRDRKWLYYDFLTESQAREHIRLTGGSIATVDEEPSS